LAGDELSSRKLEANFRYSVRSVVPTWVSIGIFPMMKLARRGIFGQGVLALYVLAMLLVMTFGGLWIACHHGDCL
jgi:hypothetical protein